MIELIQDDAIAALKRLLEQGQTWDYCCTSPPFFNLIDYGHPGQYGLEQSLNGYLDLIQDAFRLIYEGMAQRGVMWLNIAPTISGYSTVKPRGRRSAATSRRKPTPGYRSGEEIPVPWLLLERLQADGWFHRETLIWHQGHANQQPGNVPTRNFEYIFVLGKHEITRPKLDYGPTSSSVLIYPSESHPEHPCKMAQGLADVLLSSATRKNAIVIDPFIGTGTTAIAAHRRGYDAIGIDLNIGTAQADTAALQQTLKL
jgi:DNA modification methylase